MLDGLYRKFKWIDDDDSELLDWAERYLYKQGVSLGSEAGNFGKASSIRVELNKDFELAKKMRSAWDQRNSRRRSKLAQVNFYLSHESKGQLKALAKVNRLTQSQMIEYLIGKAGNELVEMREDYKKKVLANKSSVKASVRSEVNRKVAAELALRSLVGKLQEANYELATCRVVGTLIGPITASQVEAVEGEYCRLEHEALKGLQVNRYASKDLRSILTPKIKLNDGAEEVISG